MHNRGTGFLRVWSENDLSEGLDSTGTGRGEVRACAKDV